MGTPPNWLFTDKGVRMGVSEYMSAFFHNFLDRHYDSEQNTMTGFQRLVDKNQKEMKKDGAVYSEPFTCTSSQNQRQERE